MQMSLNGMNPRECCISSAHCVRALSPLGSSESPARDTLQCAFWLPGSSGRRGSRYHTFENIELKKPDALRLLVCWAHKQSRQHAYPRRTATLKRRRKSSTIIIKFLACLYLKVFFHGSSKLKVKHCHS